MLKKCNWNIFSVEIDGLLVSGSKNVDNITRFYVTLLT